jgi:pantoate kinase
MKISERDLRRIIKEELNYLNEDGKSRFGALGDAVTAAFEKLPGLEKLFNKAANSTQVAAVLDAVINQLIDNFEDTTKAEDFIKAAVKKVIEARKAETAKKK